MKTQKGNEILTEYVDARMAGSDGYELQTMLFRKLKGQIIIDEAELRDLIEKCSICKYNRHLSRNWEACKEHHWVLEILGKE